MSGNELIRERRKKQRGRKLESFQDPRWRDDFSSRPAGERETLDQYVARGGTIRKTAVRMKGAPATENTEFQTAAELRKCFKGIPPDPRTGYPIGYIFWQVERDARRIW